MKKKALIGLCLDSYSTTSANPLGKIAKSSRKSRNYVGKTKKFRVNECNVYFKRTAPPEKKSDSNFPSFFHHFPPLPLPPPDGFSTYNRTCFSNRIETGASLALNAIPTSTLALP